MTWSLEVLWSCIPIETHSPVPDFSLVPSTTSPFYQHSLQVLLTWGSFFFLQRAGGPQERSFLVSSFSQWVTNPQVPEGQILVPFQPMLEHTKQTEIVGERQASPSNMWSVVRGKLTAFTILYFKPSLVEVHKEWLRKSFNGWIPYTQAKHISQPCPKTVRHWNLSDK